MQINTPEAFVYCTGLICLCIAFCVWRTINVGSVAGWMRGQIDALTKRIEKLDKFDERIKSLDLRLTATQIKFSHLIEDEPEND